MITIYIDNKPYKVKEGQNLLNACLSLGFNIPYFCWHPAMHSVGACRQCAVKEFKDENDTRGRIIMSCMTPLKEGMRVSIEDPEAKSFRKSIVELLMLNHPHDCPVCDEGGECHLQDMTVMTGHVYRRTTFKKRTYLNQYLGPFLAHEMNRCIQCYRCVRYYRDYAGGRDLDVFAAHDHVYFGRHKDGVLQNEFSGNLAEICPTGVFTDKTFQKHYTRKWDLQTAPSICVHCGVGCNTIPGERYKELRRIRCRYNGEVNRYFLCDRGRFGYEFVNSEIRYRQAFIKNVQNSSEAVFPNGGKPIQSSAKDRTTDFENSFTAVSPNKALGFIKEIITNGKGVIGIGSPRASLESNFALRTLVGAENFYSGMNDKEAELVTLILDILRNGPARSPSLRDVEACDAVFVLGEDVTNTAPLLALSLRQAARQKSLETAGKQRIPHWDDVSVRNATMDVKGTVYVAAPYRTKLEEVAIRTYHASNDDIARLGFAVASELNNQLPKVTGLDSQVQLLAADIARDLRNAKRPLIVSGMGCASDSVIRAAANIAWALCGKDRSSSLAFAVPECNTLGLGMMNAAGLGKAFQAIQSGKADTAIIVENDLYRRAPEDAVNSFFGTLKDAIVIDQLVTPTAMKAACVLPTAAFAEADGTLVNCEGRAQRFYQVFVPEGDIQESWRWLRDITTAAARVGGREWEALDDVIASLSVTMSAFSAVPDIAPPAGFRIAGMRIPRQPHRYSGRTAMFADKTVFEPRPPKDHDSALAFSMEGFTGQPPAALIPRFWAPGWNSPQAMNKFQSEIGGSLQGGDPGKRLIEQNALSAEKVAFFKNYPEAFVPRKDAWLMIPVYHIFGSDEMSLLSPPVAELAPKPYVGLNPELTRNLSLKEGETVTVTIGQASFLLPVKLIHGLPAGVAALPAGLPEINTVGLPAWGGIAASKPGGTR